MPGGPAVLCGGRGTRSFAAKLVSRWPGACFVVNAYDDGRSTGRLRRHLDILGPSDMAKIVTNLTIVGREPGLSSVLESRLPSGIDSAAAQRMLVDMVLASSASTSVRRQLAKYVRTCIAEIDERPGDFCWDDLAVRNAVLVGCRMVLGSYQGALDELRDLLGLTATVVLVSENQAYLAGLTDGGQLLPSEEAICRGPERCDLPSIWWLKHRLDGWSESWTQATAELDPASLAVVSPRATDRASECVAGADAVIYAPGTLYSSVLPTVALLESEVRIGDRPKVLVSNLRQEWERLTVARTVDALSRASAIMQQPSNNDLLRYALISHVVADRCQRNARSLRYGRLIPVDERRLGSDVRVLYSNLEDPIQPGVHAADALVTVLASVL